MPATTTATTPRPAADDPLALEHLVVLIALGTALPAVRPTLGVIYGARGRELVPVLKETGLLLLVYGVALGVTLSLA